MVQKPVWTEEPGGLRAEEHVSGGVSSKSQGPEVQASQDQGVQSRMSWGEKVSDEVKENDKVTLALTGYGWESGELGAGE